MLKHKDNAIQKLGKCGSGTYGTVYSAMKGEKKIAVKTFFKHMNTTGVASLRELDILKRFDNHPYIVTLESFSFEPPFPMSPVAVESHIADNLYMSMEFVDVSLSDFIYSQWAKYPVLKALMAQMAIAIDYVHAHDVMHCDIKLSNFLVKVNPQFNDVNMSEEEQAFYGFTIKLGDFGLAQTTSNTFPGDHDMVAIGYRPPELCCYNPYYGPEIDIWCLGYAYYNMLAKMEYFYGDFSQMNPKSMFEYILNSAETLPSAEVVEKLQIQGKHFAVKPDPAVPRVTMKNRLMINDESTFNSSPGTLDECASMINMCLTIDPATRPSTGVILGCPFFDGLRKHINKVMSKYEPDHKILPILIKDSPGRQKIYTEAIAISGDKALYSWYTHQILFHGLDIYEQYLQHVYKGGKLDDMLIFWCSLYLSYKYYNIRSIPVAFVKFVPPKYCNQKSLDVSKHFEMDVLINSPSIHRDTLLEFVRYFGHDITDLHVIDMLQKLRAVKKWNMSSRRLYRTLYKIDE